MIGILFFCLSCSRSNIIWNWKHLFIIVIVGVHAGIIWVKCENPSRKLLKLTVKIDFLLFPNIFVFIFLSFSWSHSKQSYKLKEENILIWYLRVKYFNVLKASIHICLVSLLNNLLFKLWIVNFCCKKLSQSLCRNSILRSPTIFIPSSFFIMTHRQASFFCQFTKHHPALSYRLKDLSSYV